jgi:hypothetical protein
VHALDTTGRTAASIDLDGLSPRRDVYALRLAVDDAARELTVTDHSAPVAVIDTRTFQVHAQAAADDGGHGGSEPLLWAAVAVAALGLAAAISRVLRRRRKLVRA